MGRVVEEASDVSDLGRTGGLSQIVHMLSN